MRELHLTPRDLGIDVVTIGDLRTWQAILNGEAAGLQELQRRNKPRVK